MDRYCRVCARCDEFRRFSITTVSQISDVGIDDMLIYCTQLEVSSGDGLPQQICDDCLSALNSAFKFRKMCFHSDTMFREMGDTYLEPEQPLLGIPQQVTPNNQLLHLLPVPDSNFADVGIKQEYVEQNEFFDSMVSTSELSEFPVHYQSIDKETKAILSKAVRSKASTVYVCLDCKYSSTIRYNFTRHQKTRNHIEFTVLSTKNPVEPSNQKGKNRKRKQRADKNVNKYTCEICGYQNTNYFNFKRHQSSGKHLRNRFRIPKNQEEILQNFKCDFCDYSSTNKSSMLSHNDKCKDSIYLDETVDPAVLFDFTSKRVIDDCKEIELLQGGNGEIMFQAKYILENINTNNTTHRPPVKLITSITEYDYCYKITMRGFRCCACSMFFENGPALNKHRKVAHPYGRISDEAVNLCDKCNTPYYRQDSFLHHKLLKKSKSLLFCTICEITMVGSTAWINHCNSEHNRKIIHDSYEKVIVAGTIRCCSCDCLFSSLEQLETHQTEIHFPVWQNSVDNLEHECDKCFKQFSTLEQLKRHITLRTSRTVYRCLNKGCLMEFQLEKEIVAHVAVCSITENVAEVKIKQEPVTELICCFKDCYEILTSVRDLQNHVERAHIPITKRTEAAKYVCQFCNFESDTTETSDGHKFVVQGRHRSKKRLKCSICAVIFRNEHRLFLHEEIHKQAETNKCAFCERICSNAVSLKMHAITNHTKYKLICTICGKYFRNKHGLRKHVSVHDNFCRFRCFHCNFKTKSKNVLKLHVFMHLRKKNRKTARSIRIKSKK
ncbi:zinc finger protein 62-like [Malaya genurostris]|uniref:zinc finger protein 62-like n=1 Tax=Malaya genurostris TaxID=325434 RepID=UPI0026F3F4F7|nr:zinc finger protein 62-like [Malaya genurostris]